MNRGDRREDIFADDRDRERFLLTLHQACEKTTWQAVGVDRGAVRMGSRGYLT